MDILISLDANEPPTGRVRLVGHGDLAAGDNVVRFVGWLDLLASGRQAIMLVEGEAGLGKTRLLTETLEHARRRGFQVATGRGEELERTRPFGVVAEALGCVRSSSDPRRAAVAELLATHEGSAVRLR